MSFWSVLVKVVSHQQSVLLILIFSFMFSGATSMLSNIAFVLEDHFG